MKGTHSFRMFVFSHTFLLLWELSYFPCFRNCMSFYFTRSRVVRDIWEIKSFPAGKNLSPGRPEHVPLQRPQDSPKDPVWPSWGRPEMAPGDVLIWRSRDVPGNLIRDVRRTFSERPLEDLQSTQTWFSQICFNFFFTTYLIDQI